eukprot:jgi/Botrbrau1/23125/Bobra.0243s0055.1
MSLPLSYSGGCLNADRVTSTVRCRRSSILGRPNTLRVPSNVKSRTNHVSLHVRAGLFDNIFPGGAPVSKPSGRAGQLAEELLELAEPTDAGFRASAEVRERIEELAGELKQFNLKNPTKRPQFWGAYEVVYCSNPNAPGGPVLRSAPGQALARDQKLIQILEQPDTLINRVEYKSFGLVPGANEQKFRLSVVDGNRYKVEIDAKGEGPNVRIFEVLYLDESLRVTRYLPEGREPQIFVFRRLSEEEEEEEEEAVEEKKGGFDLASLLVKPRESLATQAERAYANEAPPAPKRAAPFPFGGGGTAKAAAAPPKPAPPKGPTKEELAKQRAAALAEAAAKKEAEAKARATVSQQIEEIKASLKAIQEEARNATKELKDAEREATGVLRQARPSRQLLEKFESEVVVTEGQLLEAKETAARAADELKEALARLREAERAVPS